MEREVEVVEHDDELTDEERERGLAPRRYGKDERFKLMDAMLEQKYRQRATWDDIADTHGVARSTIRRWRSTDEWRLADARWRRVMREEARSDVAMTSSDMVGVLQDLAHGARSEFVRYSAASKLIDLFGVGDELEEQRMEQGNELMKFMQQLDERRRENDRLRAAGIDPDTVIEAEVRPGGLLPDVIDTQNRLLNEEAFSFRKEVEAEIEEG